MQKRIIRFILVFLTIFLCFFINNLNAKAETSNTSWTFNSFINHNGEVDVPFGRSSASIKLEYTGGLVYEYKISVNLNSNSYFEEFSSDDLYPNYYTKVYKSSSIDIESEAVNADEFEDFIENFEDLPNTTTLLLKNKSGIFSTSEIVFYIPEKLIFINESMAEEYYSYFADRDGDLYSAATVFAEKINSESNNSYFVDVTRNRPKSTERISYEKNRNLWSNKIKSIYNNIKSTCGGDDDVFKTINNKMSLSDRNSIVQQIYTSDPTTSESDFYNEHKRNDECYNAILKEEEARSAFKLWFKNVDLWSLYNSYTSINNSMFDDYKYRDNEILLFLEFALGGESMDSIFDTLKDSLLPSIEAEQSYDNRENECTRFYRYYCSNLAEINGSCNQYKNSSNNTGYEQCIQQKIRDCLSQAESTFSSKCETSIDLCHINNNDATKWDCVRNQMIPGCRERFLVGTPERDACEGSITNVVNENISYLNDVERHNNEIRNAEISISNFRINIDKLTDKINCEDISWAHGIYVFIIILAPILVILLGSFDFAMAMISSDQEKMNKFKDKFKKRIISLLLLILVPILVNIIVGSFGLGDTLLKCVVKGK